jgi:hypothetical protein
MATKILVGLVVALLGTGLGVYVAFRDTAPPPVADPQGAVSVSEGGCCSQGNSCCEAEPQGACCDAASASPSPEALAAFGGGATVVSAPAQKKIVSLNANVQ